MLTLSTLQKISSSEANRKLMDWYLQEYRSMIEREPRERLLTTMVGRNMFYVPTNNYIRKIFGNEIFMDFVSTYQNNVGSLTKSLCMPLKTLSDDILGLVLNNPHHEEKYRYPVTGTFNKSRYLQTDRAGLTSAISSGYIILVEGVFDELSLSAIKQPALGLSGSSLNWDRAQIIDNIPVKIILSDEDYAGNRMLLESQKMLSGRIICARLPVKDIDLYLRSETNSKKFLSKIEANKNAGWSTTVMDLR